MEMKLTTKQKQELVRKKAREILEEYKDGIRYMDLVRKIQKSYPEIKIDLIKWEVTWLPRNFRDILRPERGLLIFEKYYKEYKENEFQDNKKNNRILEEDFYKPFADYLVNELEECTKAIPLGGSKFQDRWGTPDVLGVYKVLGLGHIQPPIEIISAEIKTDTNQLITSFGQACSYKLFSHKVYLVIPKDANWADIKRIESLCLKFGIGLILFDKNNKENPAFEILTRAVKSEPDYFYLNKYLRLIEEEAKELLF